MRNGRWEGIRTSSRFEVAHCTSWFLSCLQIEFILSSGTPFNQPVLIGCETHRLGRFVGTVRWVKASHFAVIMRGLDVSKRRTASKARGLVDDILAGYSHRSSQVLRMSDWDRRMLDQMLHSGRRPCQAVQPEIPSSHVVLERKRRLRTQGNSSLHPRGPASKHAYLASRCYQMDSSDKVADCSAAMSFRSRGLRLRVIVVPSEPSLLPADDLSTLQTSCPEDMTTNQDSRYQHS